MTTNGDTIRIVERLMLVQFASTGQVQGLSNLKIDGITITKDGTRINACYNDANPPFLLDSFTSEPLAASAFKRLQAALTRHARLRRIAIFGKGLVTWVIGPTSLLMLVLALNMLATRAVAPTMQASTAAAASLLPVPTSIEAIQQGMGIAPQSLPVVTADEISRAMADGVRAKKYSLQLSQGTKGTLYVFSDPSCSHCQQLEGELEKLARDYTIHVFPVSVFGRSASNGRVADVLCQKPEARAARWKQAVSGRQSDGAPCADGVTATLRNNEMFNRMGFEGTPAIISSAGEPTPNYLDNSADSISQWMSARARR